MRILFVCGHYYPDNFLINDICEELVKKGHEVSVLTGLPSYANGNIPKEYKSFKKRDEVIRGAKVHRVIVTKRGNNKLLRAINYFSFYLNSSIYALFNKFDTDVIFAYQLAPILMVNASIIIKNKTKKSLFLYCLDPWPDQLKVWNVKEDNILYKLIHKYSKYAYSKADLIGVSSPSFKDYLINTNCISEDKIIYLPQHANKLEISTVNKDECIDIVYGGSIGLQQNLTCLIKAIPLINSTNKYHFHILGDGTELGNCKKLSEELNINEYISFYGRVDKEELSKVYSKADAFFLSLASSSSIGFSANTIPARLQGYLSIGKPIIASIDGDTSKIIKENNLGLVSKAEDEKTLANILSEFINSKNKYDICGKNAYNYYLENYQKDIVIKKIENILKNL